MAKKVNQIRRWRLRNGKTQEWLAQQLSVKQPTVAAWEVNKTNPKPAHCIKLHELTGLSLHAIRPDLYGKGT